jgi:hypothetical protein
LHRGEKMLYWHVTEPAADSPPTLDGPRLFGKCCIYALLALGVFWAVWWYRGGASNHRQSTNMRAVDEYIPSLQPLLDRQTRFSRIRLSTFTASNGSLLVEGELESEEELDALKKLVADSHPPADVLYHVEVVPPEVRKMREENRAKLSGDEGG